MKKYATVPFRCKIKRFLRRISESGIRIKRSTEIGFSRKKDITPDKTYTLGGERFISVKTLLCTAAVVLSAVLAALLAAKLVFSAAVYKKSRR